MELLLILCFLFFTGSILGWCIEVLYRRFISSANPQRKWINPGFCKGPYLPLYGTELCIVYLMVMQESRMQITNPIWSRILLFIFMAICTTAIEYIAGVVSLKLTKVRLWDYRNQWGNIQGHICPKFSIIWSAIGVAYYFLLHPYVVKATCWLAGNFTFTFVIVVFFVIFIIDALYSAESAAKIKGLNKRTENIEIEKETSYAE